MWELDHKESWALKNWCFWTVVLEKTLESPLHYKELKPVNPKGNPKYSLEGLRLKPKLQYFGHLMRRTDSLEKMKAGGEGDDRGWDSWIASLTRWTGARSWSWWWTGKPGVLQCMRFQSWTQLSDWQICLINPSTEFFLLHSWHDCLWKWLPYNIRFNAEELLMLLLADNNSDMVHCFCFCLGCLEVQS